MRIQYHFSLVLFVVKHFNESIFLLLSIYLSLSLFLYSLSVYIHIALSNSLFFNDSFTLLYFTNKNNNKNKTNIELFHTTFHFWGYALEGRKGGCTYILYRAWGDHPVEPFTNVYITLYFRRYWEFSIRFISFKCISRVTTTINNHNNNKLFYQHNNNKFSFHQTNVNLY